MNNAGDWHKDFLHITLLIRFFQLLGEAQVVTVRQEILFPSVSVPGVGEAHRERFTVYFALALGQVLDVGDLAVVCQATILIVDKVEVTEVGVHLVTISQITAKKSIAQQLVAV